jgi:hypothetical protein
MKPPVQSVEVRGHAFRVQRAGMWGRWHVVESADTADAVAARLAGCAT